jgi:F0F1-type ATP synthase membrane subunit b/b'
MTLNLVADRTVKGRIYPALAQWEARPYTQSWREFGSHYPYTVPFRPQEYCEHHGVKINIYQAKDDLPLNCYYPIGLGFFDFDIDYFGLISAALCDRIRQNDLRVLFYYHEGDNPERIKHRLDQLVQNHQLPADCYVFVSANSAADQLPGFVYFADFELWYWQRNHGQPPLAVHSQPREREFTVLNRLHKSWRATAMADLHRHGILNRSYWSYCETGALDNNNPIEIDSIDGLTLDTKQFLSRAPYISDELDQAERNNHAVTQSKYHVNSYCNIVMETHFDADQSGGSFLTEKTFKPIKHGQLFFVAGAVGSLQALRDLGYRTFDSVLDNSYDQIENNTQRWTRLRASIQQAQHQLEDRFAAAKSDILHNQRLFQQLKTQRLNTLIGKIHEQHR